ncbi:hypothetical protein N9L02_01985 [Gammaproteobacteria bacterium]|nr:hypothetical protein [Gammaproteobacteria bacterium]
MIKFNISIFLLYAKNIGLSYSVIFTSLFVFDSADISPPSVNPKKRIVTTDPSNVIYKNKDSRENELPSMDSSSQGYAIVDVSYTKPAKFKKINGACVNTERSCSHAYTACVVGIVGLNVGAICSDDPDCCDG